MWGGTGGGERPVGELGGPLYHRPEFRTGILEQDPVNNDFLLAFPL